MYSTSMSQLDNIKLLLAGTGGWAARPSLTPTATAPPRPSATGPARATGAGQGAWPPTGAGGLTTVLA